MNRQRRMERQAMKMGAPIPIRAKPVVEKPREKTLAEITDEKMAAMAAHPDAVTVYWTENGPDAKGWDIIFPEYRILSAAFEGGYGWWDLTEGRGQHLLPPQRPYKVVNITSAELKGIRAKEAAEEAAALAEKQRLENLKIEAYQASLRRQEAELKKMAEEDAFATQMRAAEQLEDAVASILATVKDLPVEKQKTEYLADLVLQSANLLTIDSRDAFIDRVCPVIEGMIQEAQRILRQQRLEKAFKSILEEVRDLPVENLYEGYLIDFIVDRADRVDAQDIDALLTRVCPVIESEGLLFVTAHSSPIGSRSTSPIPFEAAEVPEQPEVTVVVEKTALKLSADLYTFLNQSPFYFNGCLYLPALDSYGYPIFVPRDNIQKLPWDPIPVEFESGSQGMNITPHTIVDSNWMPREAPPLPCVEPCCVWPPLPREAPPPCLLSCCVPPPLPPSLMPPLLPTPPPLPPSPPPSPPKQNIKIRKLRMPRKRHIQKLLNSVAPELLSSAPLRSPSLRDWKNPVTLQAIRS